MYVSSILHLNILGSWARFLVLSCLKVWELEVECSFRAMGFTGLLVQLLLCWCILLCKNCEMFDPYIFVAWFAGDFIDEGRFIGQSLLV